MTGISFAWTTPAVLAGHFTPKLSAKTETRRDWKPVTIKKFQRIAGSGEPVAAWTKQPGFQGARHFATIKILEVEPSERSGNIPDEAWHAEGFGMLQAIGAGLHRGYSARHVWEYWRVEEPGNIQTVCRFELLDITPAGFRIWMELEQAHGAMLLERPNWDDFAFEEEPV